MRLFISMLICSCFLPVQGNSQLLNKIIKRTTDKAVDKAGDMLVEKISDELARRIYLSMDDAFDKMLANARLQDSVYRANYGDSLGMMTADWMARMNEAADLPDQFQFDIHFLVETSHNKQDQEINLFYSKNEPIFAMQTIEKGSLNTIVVDGEKDVTVLYRDENGKKSAQAIPNLMGMAGAMSQTYANQETQEEYTINKTGKTKKFAGYRADEYVGESDDYTYTFYFSDDLDLDWENAYGPLVERFGNFSNSEEFSKVSGMFIASYSTGKKGKDESSWETKEINEKSMVINNADYQFGNLQ